MSKTPEKVSVEWFLYNPENKKVWLHLRDNNAPSEKNKWDYFGGNGNVGETPVKALLRELYEELTISTDLDKVKPLHDYFDGGFHKYMFYILSTLKKKDMALREGADFDCFSFEDAFKLDLTDRARESLLILKKCFY